MTTTLEIHTRSLVLDGRAFGAAGAYEKIAGVLRFETDPGDPRNASITDLDRAPRNAAGRVESVADFYLLKPVDAARGNRRLLLDIPNRGRKVALGLFNSTPRVSDPSTPEDFGNGFLMRQGYTVAWCGWQHDVPRRDGLMALTVPTARTPSGPIVGTLSCEFRPNVPVDVLPLADRYHIPHPSVDQNDPAATLTVRDRVGAEAVAIDRRAWRFARRENGALVADPSHIHLARGFEPGKIYALLYRSQDPPLIGLGLLAVRDTGAFLKYASAADGNPCAGDIERAYVFGVSQTGRFLRHFLYLGLNDDAEGREVFDAVFPHVAGARRGEFNMRFGQPSLSGAKTPGNLFPFTDAGQIDPVTGQRGGLLDRFGSRPPKIFATNTSAEYWRGDASLIHTDVEGTADVEPPANVRTYLFAGTQHVSGPIPPQDADPNTGARGLQPFNTVDYAPLLRAALVNLDRWITDGVEPPPSAVPRLRDGTLVEPEAVRATLLSIPGARFPDRVARPRRLDFGKDWPRGIASELPPKLGAPFRTFVTAVDADGNEVAGIRAAEVAVPVATFTGWNLRHPDQGAPGDLMQMMGSTLPFPRTRAERQARHDPRASIAERYGSRDRYLERVRDAAQALVARRHVLEEDAETIVARAGLLYDFVDKHPGQ